MLTFACIAARTFFALSVSAAPLAAQATWVVDDDGGPGVDFTIISAALAVAGPFDVIDVRPGQYTSFSVVRPARTWARSAPASPATAASWGCLPAHGPSSPISRSSACTPRASRAR